MEWAEVLAVATPIVKAAIDYLRNQAAAGAGDKAIETVSEKATESALTKLRELFTRSGDAKATKALANVEDDPDDPDYAEKLVKETARPAPTTRALPAVLLHRSRCPRPPSPAPSKLLPPTAECWHPGRAGGLSDSA